MPKVNFQPSFGLVLANLYKYSTFTDKALTICWLILSLYVYKNVVFIPYIFFKAGKYFCIRFRVIALFQELKHV